MTNLFSEVILLQGNIVVGSLTQGTTVLIVLFILLVMFSFIVSGAEVAYFSLSRKDINMLRARRQPTYSRIITLLNDTKLLMTTLVIAHTISNIFIIIVSNLIIDSLFVFHLQWLGILVKVMSIAIIMILFCEIMPKIMATQNYIRFARDVAFIVSGVLYTFTGFGRMFLKYSEMIERKLSKNTNASTYSLEELDHAIDMSVDQNASEEEKNILKGIVNFGNITVKQVMKTRIDVSGIEYNTSFSTLINQVEELHYSRLPVFREKLDEVVGIIHTKDLLPYLENTSEFDWHSLMRVPYFVHEQKFIEDLLKEFQSKHIHFAVVVDEFGGTSGIVTLEDILEEIVGEIKDEFDEEDSEYKKIDDSNFIFEGRIMINKACKVMNISQDTFDQVRGESDSLAGLVLEIAGEIPQINQVIVCGDFQFTVLEIEKNRLQKIKVSIKLREI